MATQRLAFTIFFLVELTMMGRQDSIARARPPTTGQLQNQVRFVLVLYSSSASFYQYYSSNPQDKDNHCPNKIGNESSVLTLDFLLIIAQILEPHSFISLYQVSKF